MNPQNYTTLILKENEPEATGLFVKYSSKYFILSTAHQFWNNDKTDFKFTYANSTIAITAQHYYMNPKEESEDDLDFSQNELSHEVVLKKMDMEDFYDLKSELPRGLNILENNYIFGFLANRYHFKNGALFHEPFEFYFNEPKFEEPSSFFSIKYKRRKVFLKRFKRSVGPIPKGCSGCGIWNLNSPRAVLIGMLTEYNANRAEIKALKIPVVTNFIEKYLS